MKTFDEVAQTFNLSEIIGDGDPEESVKKILTHYGGLLTEIQTHPFTIQAVQDQINLYVYHMREQYHGENVVCASMLTASFLTMFTTGIIIGMRMEQQDFPDVK